MSRLAGVILVVTACACGAQAQTAARTTEPSSSTVAPVAAPSLLPSVNPSAAAHVALRPCAPQDVTGAFDHWGVAAGSYGASFRLAPASRDPCNLPEHPVVRFVDQRGDRLLFVDDWPDPVRWLPVRIATGEDATFFIVLWSNHGGQPSYTCARRTTPISAVEIELPAGPVTLEFPTDSRPALCTEPKERAFAQVVARQP